MSEHELGNVSVARANSVLSGALCASWSLKIALGIQGMSKSGSRAEVESSVKQRSTNPSAM